MPPPRRLSYSIPPAPSLPARGEDDGLAGVQAISMHRSPSLRVRPWLALALALAVAACASSRSGESAEPKPYDPSATNLPERSIGYFLVDLDASVRAWNRLVLTASGEDEQRRATLLADDLTYRARKRKDDLLGQLETGPPFNRMVAAAGLGFSRDPDVVPPLLAALEDPEAEVVANALLGLALVASPETPTGGIAEHLRSGANTRLRSNAAYALREILEARGWSSDEVVLAAAREGLADPEPAVRAQCALLVAGLRDVESVERLGLIVHDKVPIAALAAGRALAFLGSREPRVKGASARALAGALDKVEPAVRSGLLRSLAALAEANYGRDSEAWVEWAHRLP